jgi:hypothetical protein
MITNVQTLQKWEKYIAYIVLASTPFVITPITFDSFLAPKYMWLSLWAALWLVLIVLQTSTRTLIRTPLDWPILAFVCVSLFSLLIHYRSPIQLRAFTHLCIFVFYYYAYRRFWIIHPSQKKIAKTIAFIALALAAYGIAQDYGYDFTDKVGGVRDWRAKVVATLGNPNFLAGYLGIALPVLFGLGWRRDAGLFSTLLSGTAILIVTMCIALTFCVGVTTGILGMLIVTASILIIGRIKPRISIFRFVLFCLLSVCGVSWYLLDNPYNSHGRSLYKEAWESPHWWSGMGAREFNWRTTRIMIDEKPCTGIGFGNYLSVHLHYQGINYAELENDAHDRENVVSVDQPHFQLLETVSESGPAGLFTLCWLACAWLVSAWRTLHRDLKNGWFAWGSYCGVWVAIIHSFSSFPFHLPANSLLVVALAAYHTTGSNIPQPVLSSKRSEKLLVFIIALGLIPSAYIEFQGNRYLRQGYESYLRGNTLGAIVYLEEARRYDPLSHLAHSILGISYIQKGWYTEAVQALEQAIWLQEDLMAHKYLSKIYLQTGNLDQAIREQRRVVELNPIFPNHLRDLASLLRQNKQDEEAAQLEERAQEMDRIIEKKYP